MKYHDNLSIITNDICIIFLNSEEYKGLITLIDTDQADKVLEYSWSTYYTMDKAGKRRFYARSRINGEPTLLHRFLMGESNGLIIDHINNKSLDNRLVNLRFVTYQENLQNTDRKPMSITEQGNRFRVRLAGKSLGMYGTREEAEQIYKKAHAEKYKTISPYYYDDFMSQ